MFYKKNTQNICSTQSYRCLLIFHYNKLCSTSTYYIYSKKQVLSRVGIEFCSLVTNPRQTTGNNPRVCALSERFSGC